MRSPSEREERWKRAEDLGRSPGALQHVSIKGQIFYFSDVIKPQNDTYLK